MTEEIAVVGDIHGNSAALSGMLRMLSDWEGLLVFTGDYVNRGPDSAGVIQLLIDLSTGRPNTFFVAGNHDVALRDAIASGKLFSLLSMGGAPTIKSYVETPKGDVGEQLRRSVPRDHIEFLSRLLPSFTHNRLVVTHGSNDPISDQAGDQYHVYGHVPTADGKPRIGAHSAAIDTGCGLSAGGRLTCFFWPARVAKQVDAQGVEVTTDRE
ncbi:metallophosphoesterase [Mycobacterium simiae]|uniref:Calcineurin-like phosphoesterase domain-containing protein n=1 Tax=Mycobacterium simiae TaxID=1784 RepID=A0A1X0YGK3_MYCSI|nr:metallophosphoesterase [Mycobacterium simiae]ORJ64323.1 hypothetical protein B5M45_03840 [Mycobacterium simiae]